MKMESFMKHSLKFDQDISASFISFLTKQTGSNVSAGIRGKLKVLEIKLSKQIKDTEAGATVWGEKALITIDPLYTKNPNLTKSQTE